MNDKLRELVTTYVHTYTHKNNPDRDHIRRRVLSPQLAPHTRSILLDMKRATETRFAQEKENLRILELDIDIMLVEGAEGHEIDDAEYRLLEEKKRIAEWKRDALHFVSIIEQCIAEVNFALEAQRRNAVNGERKLSEVS